MDPLLLLALGGGALYLLSQRRLVGQGPIGGQEPGQTPGTSSQYPGTGGPSGSVPQPLTFADCQTWDGTFNTPPTSGQLFCADTYPQLYPAGHPTRPPVAIDAPAADVEAPLYFHIQPIGMRIPFEA